MKSHADTCTTLLARGLALVPILSFGEFIQGDYAYDVIDGKAVIIGFNWEYAGDLAITNNLGDYPVTRIETEAFAWCEGLTGVTIPASVASIGNDAFTGCTSLTRATFLNDLSIFSARAAFGDGGGALRSVLIGDAVAEVGGQAFARCTGLTNAVIGAGVAHVAGGAFYGCTGLLEIVLAGEGASYCSTNGVLFDKARTRLVQYPGGKSGSYEVPDRVTAIGNHAFAGCSGLADVSLPEGLCAIDLFAFSCCPNLPSVTVPSSVTNIGGGAFAPHVTLLGEPMPAGAGGSGAWTSERSGLTAIHVAAGNAHYSSTNGVLFNSARTRLIQYPGGRHGGYAMPDGVNEIDADAFNSCTGLTALSFASAVSSIGVLAFENCTGLTTLRLPSALSSIGYWAFLNCSHLTNVYFCGDAPSLSTPDVLDGTPSTVYYLPGANGWEAEFCGRPARCWNPHVQADGSLGYAGGTFSFTLAGTPGIPVVIEACTDLAVGDWTPVESATLGVDGSFPFADPAAASHPARFYRFVWP